MICPLTVRASFTLLNSMCASFDVRGTALTFAKHGGAGDLSHINRDVI
ncbi:hypothetical protein IMCC12053_226 [Celeribacter marinus]|uniref:Uncharacterized protein n=1 Tax=Celeribacter marinus TaxID=1397108 RepID=A0A0P0A8B1_9RHOB|nr:hypothetical protein IMCC12053_226 [Celeribacter marinus]